MKGGLKSATKYQAMFEWPLILFFKDFPPKIIKIFFIRHFVLKKTPSIVSILIDSSIENGKKEKEKFFI